MNDCYECGEDATDLADVLHADGHVQMCDRCREMMDGAYCAECGLYCATDRISGDVCDRCYPARRPLDD